MELSSYDKQHIQNLIERLYLTATTVSRVAHGDRTLNMVKADINYIASELENLVDEAWHLKDEEEVVSKNLCEHFLWETLPEIKPASLICEHDKAYAGWILTSDPPKTQWICRKCHKQGMDEGVQSSRSGEDYRILLQEVIEKVVKGEK